MKALHTAHHTPVPNHYCIKDASGKLITTICPATKDLNIFRINWVGGAKHGKQDLSEGNLSGAMEFIALNA